MNGMSMARTANIFPNKLHFPLDTAVLDARIIDMKGRVINPNQPSPTDVAFPGAEASVTAAPGRSVFPPFLPAWRLIEIGAARLAAKRIGAAKGMPIRAALAACAASGLR